MANDIKELLKSADGLLSGHFCLTSGLHSDTYFQCAKLYQYPDIVEYLSHMVGVVKPVRNIKDMMEAFDLDTKKAFGKTIMKWEK